MLQKEEFEIVKLRIIRELQNMKTKVENVLKEYKLFPEIKTDKIKGLPLHDDLIRRAIKVYIENYYNGAEKILLLIARNIDGDAPTGDKWHKELLEQMRLNIPGKRPAVISEKTKDLMFELHSFRYRCNTYKADLKYDELVKNLKILSELSCNFKKDINNFLKQME